MVRVVEERLVLPDRFAFVVEDRPATADPAWRSLTSSLATAVISDVMRTWFGLDLLLDLAAEAVGVGEADLDLGLLTRLQIADMGLARERWRRKAAATAPGRWDRRCES